MKERWDDKHNASRYKKEGRGTVTEVRASFKSPFMTNRDIGELFVATFSRKE